MSNLDGVTSELDIEVDPVPPSPFPAVTADQEALIDAWIKAAVVLKGPTGRNLTSTQRTAYLKFFAFQLAATPITG